MKRFIEGEDRTQSTLFPEHLDPLFDDTSACPWQSDRDHPPGHNSDAIGIALLT
jgi:hypothetical protein